MKSRRRNHARSRWAHVNTPDGLRRRRAIADAKREAIAATLPPAYVPPAPLTEWQTITITLMVPTCGRCDQHAVVIDGERVGLLSATEIGRVVAAMVRKRPSTAVVTEIRRDEWRDAFVRSRLDGDDQSSTDSGSASLATSSSARRC